MQTTIILNALQEDFQEQINECFSCYTSKLGNTKLSIIIFSLSDKEEYILSSLASTSSQNEIEKITFITTTTNNIELHLNALHNLEKEEKSTYYIFASNLWAKSICSRFAYRINACASNNIIDIQTSNEYCKLKKYSYANNCIAEFIMNKAPYCISLAKDVFELETKHNAIAKNFNNIERIIWSEEAQSIEEIACKEKVSSTSLSTAKFVVICGQGINSKEKVQEIRMLAESIGAEFGVTRPVAMNAHESIDRIVGISGNICKADICISIATSGAGAYYAGIEKCKQIIAVNTSENAAIMDKADFVIKEDGLQFMQELVKMVKNSTATN